MKSKMLFIIMFSIIIMGCDPSSDRKQACIYAISSCESFKDGTKKLKCFEKAFETVCLFHQGDDI